MNWKVKIKKEIKEASKQRKIGRNLKRVALECLEFDSEFNLIYSSSRETFINLIFKETDRGLLHYFLKNYGVQFYNNLKINKRLI